MTIADDNRSNGTDEKKLLRWISFIKFCTGPMLIDIWAKDLLNDSSSGSGALLWTCDVSGRRVWLEGTVQTGLNKPSGNILEYTSIIMSLVMNNTTGGSSGSTLTPSGGGSPKGGMPSGGCSKSSPAIFQKGSLGSDFSKTPDIFAEQ